MKDLKSNLSYKIYKNGKEFLKENEIYLNANVKTFIETSFFFLNAQGYQQLDRKNYALQFKNGAEHLFILRLDPYNMVLFGSKTLCEFAARIVADLNLVVEGVLGKEECASEFLKYYQERLKGEIELQHSMQIMVLNKLAYSPKSTVFQCTTKDIEELALCYCSFKKEALHEKMDISTAIEILKGREHTFYAIKEQGKIVSIAARARDFDSSCSISNVFTIPEYRGRGYSKQVVSKLCEDIIREGKTPNLYVDSTNPISNHLYLNLGFTYLTDQVQYRYHPSFIKTAVFAGGCFWCVAEPFYSLEGVRKVVSGFVGGKETHPSYAQVKQGTTG
ncbi:MAG: GNAT family N-acetyltransferase, partial [Anaeroplasmataceae bacterium]|nr:GNAT family N-acetyltransferase [Anaeroplasmataceae bacterium]